MNLYEYQRIRDKSFFKTPGKSIIYIVPSPHYLKSLSLPEICQEAGNALHLEMLRKFISLFSRLEIHSQPISMMVLEVLLQQKKAPRLAIKVEFRTEFRKIMGNLCFSKLFEIIVVCSLVDSFHPRKSQRRAWLHAVSQGRPPLNWTLTAFVITVCENICKPSASVTSHALISHHNSCNKNTLATAYLC